MGFSSAWPPDAIDMNAMAGPSRRRRHRMRTPVSSMGGIGGADGRTDRMRMDEDEDHYSRRGDWSEVSPDPEPLLQQLLRPRTQELQRGGTFVFSEPDRLAVIDALLDLDEDDR